MKKCDFTESLMKKLRNNPQRCADYLNDVKEDGDEKAFWLAIKIIIDAHGGMTEIAKRANLNRPSMYKALSGEGSPRIDTIDKIMNSIGLDINYSVRK